MCSGFLFYFNGCAWVSFALGSRAGNRLQQSFAIKEKILRFGARNYNKASRDFEFFFCSCISYAHSIIFRGSPVSGIFDHVRVVGSTIYCILWLRCISLNSPVVQYMPRHNGSYILEGYDILKIANYPC